MAISKQSAWGGGGRIKIVKLQLEVPILWFEGSEPESGRDVHKWRWLPNNVLSTYYLFFGIANYLDCGIRIKVTNHSVAQVTLLNGSCAAGSYRKVDRPSANAIYYNAMLYTTAEAMHTGNMQLGISTDANGTDMAVSEAVPGFYKPRT